LLLFLGCANNGSLELIEDYKKYVKLEEKISCRGKGYVLIKNYPQSRLNFNFNSTKDELFMLFKDIFGRKQFQLSIVKNKIEVFSLRKKEIIPLESFSAISPLFENIEPKDLIDFAWGVIPESFVSNSGQKKADENLILFNTCETTFGYLINEISFHNEDDITEINLFFLKREFDAIYPHLINEKI
tara:strand:- start:408 stop:965 length:558 start_codon:yes stop_codon:yes gene_type:complete